MSAVSSQFSRRDALWLGARLVGAAALAQSCAREELHVPRPVVTGPPPVRVRYGNEPDQFADLYLSDRAAPRPVVVLIHGGFWGAQYGLDLMAPLAQAFRAEGVAVWNIEYRRLGGAGGWPATFRDVGAAIDHLKVIARKHVLDLQHVAVVGHSAGGHLALWAAGRPRIATTSDLFVRWPRPVRGVVALAPVPDLRRAHAHGFDVVAKLLGGTPAAVPERYAAGSPADLLPLQVPQVVIHGQDDRIVPLRLSEEYVAAARKQGDAVTLVALKRIGHFEPIDPASPAWPAVRQHVLASVG